MRPKSGRNVVKRCLNFLPIALSKFEILSFFNLPRANFGFRERRRFTVCYYFCSIDLDLSGLPAFKRHHQCLQHPRCAFHQCIVTLLQLSVFRRLIRCSFIYLFIHLFIYSFIYSPSIIRRSKFQFYRAPPFDRPLVWFGETLLRWCIPFQPGDRR